MNIYLLPFTVYLQIDSIRLSWLWLEWFSDPLRVVLPLLFLISLPWLFRSRRWLRRVRRYAIALLISYLILISPPFVALAMAGIGSPLPSDPGTKVDVIVILGRGREQSPARVEVGAQLWREQRAPVIFASGIVDAPELVAMLRHKNILAQAVSGESCSKTTWENAVFTKALLQPQGVKQILLVTDVPHLWRSLLIFEQAGFQVIPYASPLATEMTSPQRAMLLLREYFFLATYPVTLGQEHQTLEQPLAGVIEQIASRKCRTERSVPS
ncbi:YdcF family protein [Stenomitos frigidus]|uniref:YdcF family protein n=1 Tax=Stenomitos frigidus ULC18 TaxID=2107698 RepID=A0A2T1E324_9CYAN|nr:YdcF family protein [Stenomitos frigidus]PSB27153.1 YdcF family protein [Stenomitos frigidus ULC18]